MSLVLQAPSPIPSVVFDRDGNKYTPDSNGFITVPTTGGARAVSDLLNAGFTLAEAAANLNTFGGGGAPFGNEGNIAVQLSSVAAPVNPGATGADNVLAVYSIPASSFDKAGRGINILALGNFAATNNAKRCKIILNPSTAVVGSTVGSGGTTIADTGALTTTSNNVAWSLAATLYKRGAAAANTQLAVSGGAIAGTAHLGLSLCADVTATESGAILVAVVGNATTAATDIGLSLLQVGAMN